MSLISVNQEACSQCGACTKVCPVFVLEMGAKGPEAVSPDNCFACGHCVAVCPHGALDNSKVPLIDQVDIKEAPIITSDTAEQFLRSRRSIRCYKKASVPRDKLKQLVRIAHLAPTASNSQGVSYVIVENKEIVKKAAEVTIDWLETSTSERTQYFSPLIKKYREEGVDFVLRDAPHLILAIADKDLQRGRESSVFSLAYLELFAPSLGLGSCWAGILEFCLESGYEPLIKLFNIPEGKKITGAVMVGYPQYKYKRFTDRNPLEVTFR